jgi:hypothetical protein
MLNFIKHNMSVYRPIIIGLLMAIYCTMLYLPLILKGGIIVDDWGDLGQNLGCTEFLACYLN